MAFDIWYLLIPISLSPFFWIGGKEIYDRFIRPTRFYKLVVLDQTEETITYVKKRKAIIIQDKKGFCLFMNKAGDKGEFYTVSTNEKDLPSKRDELGTITYYYWRNNSNPMILKEDVPVTIGQKKTIVLDSLNTPIEIKSNVQIEVDNDAELMFKVYNTKMFDASLMEDNKKPFSFSKQALLVIIIIIIIAVVFMAKSNGWI